MNDSTPGAHPAPPPELAPDQAPATIDLLRHGQVVGGDCLRGWQDDPLDTRGWLQMCTAMAQDYYWDRIDCSPLARCAAFATEIGNLAGIEPQCDARWRELHFGQWEGRTVAEVQRHDAAALTAFWSDPDAHPPPGGERLSQFEQRIEAAWEDLGQALQPGQRGLLVTHGGVIRLLLCRVLGLTTAQQFRFEVPHAARITVVLDARQPRLRLGPYCQESSPRP